MAFAPFVGSYTPEPSRCSTGARVGAVVLQDWICDASPWARDLWDVGIFACRDVYGGWCPNCNLSALSGHASGRAGDSACNILHPAGAALAAWLVANAAVLGVQEVIWNRRRWTNQTKRWDPYGGLSPHIDHVHWTLNESGARYLTLARILSVAPAPPAPPRPREALVFLVTQKSTGNLWLVESAGGAAQEGRRTLVPAADKATATGSDVPYLGAVSDEFFEQLIRDRDKYQA